MAINVLDLPEDVQARMFPDAAPRSRPKKYASRENDFAFQCRAFGLPDCERDYRFAKDMKRQWRFDMAFIGFKVAVEIEGIVFRRVAGQMVASGRHASPAGFEGDCWKYYSAILLGWSVLRVTPKMVKGGQAIEMVQRVLASKGWRP